MSSRGETVQAAKVNRYWFSVNILWADLSDAEESSESDLENEMYAENEMYSDNEMNLEEEISTSSKDSVSNTNIYTICNLKLYFSYISLREKNHAYINECYFTFKNFNT